MKVTALSNEDLLSGLHRIFGRARAVLVETLVYLGEVDARELFLREACSSMYVYCVERLHLSEGEAQRRLAAARAARRYPMILDAIARGDLTLTNVALLHELLTPDNHERVLRAAFGKKKIEVLELIAAERPRPDAPSLISPMPMPMQTPAAASSVAPTAAGPSSRAVVEPLAPERYKVQVTIGRALRDAIEYAKDLMRHRNPSGDLEVLLGEAMNVLVAKLEKERFAKTDRPSKKAAKSKGVSRAARREVFERDGMRCTFVDEQGHRCTARGFLEVDHVHARGRGGSDQPENLRVLCRAHNQAMAKVEYGRAHVEEQIRLCQQRSQWTTAMTALKNLGFRELDVRKAIGVLQETHVDAPMELEALIREALLLLT